MKVLITLCCFFISSVAIAQIDNELRFDCSNHDITKCNPFALSNPFCPDIGNNKNNWRVSHGSPNLRTFSGNNSSKVAVLKAIDSNGISPKGEGMFLTYNFLANHTYSIEFIVRIEDPSYFSQISLTSKVANGLTAKTNLSICGEETLPNVTDIQSIVSQVPLPYHSGNEIGLITVSNFIPTKDFSYFWIYAEPASFGLPASEFIVSHITITDLTSSITNNTICCNQFFAASTANPTLLTGSTPGGGNGSFSYQWQKRTSSTWTNIGGATSVNYDPSSINTTTSYKRVVTSGLERSESNTVTVTLDPNNTGPLPDWVNICCDQSYNKPTTPNAITSVVSPPVGEILAYRWYNPWVGGGVISNNETFQPPLLDETGQYRRFLTAKNGQVYESNFLTIEIKYFQIGTSTYSASESIEKCRGINIKGDLTTSNDATVDIISDSRINVRATSNIGPGIHLKIVDCGNQNGSNNRSMDYSYNGRLSSEINYSTYELEQAINSKNNEDLLIVYPNPSNGQISLIFSPGINTQNGIINIYNEASHKVYTQFIDKPTNKVNLDLKDLLLGNYYLQYIDVEHVINKKIIIK